MDTPEPTAREHEDLYALQAKLIDILQSVSAFSSSVGQPPIIDSSFDLAGNPAEGGEGIPRQDVVKGLRALKDSAKRDLDVLEKVSTWAQYAHSF